MVVKKETAQHAHNKLEIPKAKNRQVQQIEENLKKYTSLKENFKK